MKTKVTPLADRVLIKPIVEAEKKTNSGFIIPEKSKERPEQGKVLAIGPGKMGEDGKRLPMSVKVGDTVLFTKYGPEEVKIEGEEFFVIKEESILAVIS
jgi:chaperonin GroES